MKISSRIVVVPRENIDTDQIIPARFLKVTDKIGIGRHLFEDRPEFQVEKGFDILVAGANFGCGSSREHAVWALKDAGFRCVIAPSFADIFFSNCFKNGVLALALPQDDIDKLMDDAQRGANAIVSIDLERQEIRGPDGGCLRFEIEPSRKE